MKRKSDRQKKKRSSVRPFNLNLILWFTFLLFAIVLIAVFTLIQNFQMSRQYRAHIRENLYTAGHDIMVRLSEKDLPVADVSRVLLTSANRYGVSAYLFSEDGNFIYPDLLVSEYYSEIFADISSKIDRKYEKLPGNGKTESNLVPVPSDDAEGYAAKIELWGKTQYLYLSSSLEPVNMILRDMMWFSLISALFAATLSFVVSGFVSMVITKPVTAVTERAKSLARGDYGVKFEGNYFVTEMNDLSKALDYASEEISRADKMQKELIANVSHDFKTPLTMIKAYAAMIREISGNDPEKREKHAQIIIDETDRLAELVEDVLDLSRMQSGIDVVERTVFNLSEEVYRVAGRFDFLVETKGYTIETEIEEDLYTFAAKVRAEQALYNLIGNAINYTGEDKKVVIRLKKRPHCARFEVIDSGKGIPPEEIDTIWDRYYRSSEAHKRPVKGTGLGLSIVKSALKHYNIPFGVQSELGKGSCFWVDFPDPPEEKS